jgi:hypothetical protein
VDHRSGTVRVVDGEEGDGFGGLAQEVQQVAGGAGGEPFGREQGAVVPLGPSGVDEEREKSFFFAIQDFVKAPRGTLVLLDRERPQGNHLAGVRVVQQAAVSR